MAVGLVLVVALYVVGPRELRPIDEGSIEAPVPSTAAPPPVLKPGDATLAEIASIEDDFFRNSALYALIADASRTRLEDWLAEVETLPATRHRSDVARVLYI
ncbi:MAG: hypothetical protein F4Z28_00455, partial [Gammaproteobacteria bacterium]|nr:hypothetical protein [Gammaproteobacteria bacterium]